MANLNSMPMLKNQKGFSMHDLSHYFGFKCSTGHIVPLETDILNPNERIRLKADMFVRLNPLVTPAMIDIDCDIHYFFVPLTMLDINFGRKWSQTREIFTSMIPQSYSSESNRNLFRISLGTSIIQYRRSINNFNESATFSSSNQLECAGSRIFRLFDYFGLNPYASLRGSIHNFFDTELDKVVSPIDDKGNSVESVSNYINTFDPYLFYYQLQAYNAIWQYWYRLEDRDQFNNTFFNFDRFLSSNSSLYVSTSLFAGESAQNARMVEFFGMKYAPVRKDYFTSSFRAPVINGLNFLQGNSNDLYTAIERGAGSFSQYLNANSSADILAIDGLGNQLSEGGSLSTVEGFGEDGHVFNTQTLRIMQAKEKYMNILGRLPRKNYDNLVYALFGERVPHDVKHELSHLGHDHFTIGIGQVTSTAATADAPLGELAGQGIGSSYNNGKSSNRGVKFTAPVHGVIMAVCSFVPRRMYLGGLLRHNYITSFADFYNPVYDNLGNQPIYGFELYLTGDGSQDSDLVYSPTGIAGWQFRYEQFKRRFDRVNRAFIYGTERSWFNTTLLTPLNYPSDSDIAEMDNEFGQRSLFTTRNDFFYCRPDSLNSVMAVQYSVNWIEEWLTTERRQEAGANLNQDDLENWYLTPQLIYARDPFICLAHIDYTKFSKMSDYGLVRFD